MRSLPSKDPEKRRETARKASAKWYAANKAKQLEANSAWRKTARQKWRAFKAKLECVNCGENHPAVLDFHHIDRHDPANRKVHALVGAYRFKAAMDEVIKRCMVLCANCHRKHHDAEHRRVKKKARPKKRIDNV